jgi:hypothetical protein
MTEQPEQALFDELVDVWALKSVANEIRAREPLHGPAVRAAESLHESGLRKQELGDSSELHFGSLVRDHHGNWQPAGTPAQPYDCLVIFGGEQSLVQVKSSETQQRSGSYRFDLGRHRMNVKAFALMVRHKDMWMPPHIVPADHVRTLDWVQVWPGYHKSRKGEFNAARWRSAWWVVDPSERTEAHRNALRFIGRTA